MKKILKSVMALAIAAMTFTACEDVPEPYPTPNPNSGSSTENLQGTGTAADPFNVAAARAYIKDGGDANATVYVKGKIVSIEEIGGSYGNATYTISDDGTSTNALKVYRGYGLDGAKFTGNEIKEGDDVVIAGKLINYSGTYEFAQGNTIVSLNGTGGSGGGETEGATGDGTLENPFNAIAAANTAKALGSGNTSDKAYYIKGKVVSIATDKNGNAQNFDYGTYGNASFYISDDGKEANQFYCYRILYLGNKKWTSGAGDVLKVGDEVIVCAKLTLYNTTPETAQNEGYLYSLNGKTEGGSDQPAGDAKGTGTLEDPFNAVAATNTAQALGNGNISDKAYYIKGKVASIATDKNGNAQNFDYGTYGNASFYISDDGTETNQFYIYRVLYLGNKKWTEGAGDVLKVGDEVIVCAKLTLYNSTPETAQNEGYLYSLNGKTEGGGGETPQPSGDQGSIDAPKTVAEVLAVINAMEDGATTDANYYVKGKVAKVATAAEDIGPNSSSGKNYKDINYYISIDGTESNTIYVYRGKNLNNTDFTSADQLKVGDEVIVYGKLQKYKNSKTNEIVPEMASGNYLVKTSNTGSTPGGDNPGGGGEVSGNSISIDFSSQGFENAQEVTTITLTDGTTLTFDGGGNNNTPKYYNSGTAIRLYPKNTMTVAASKNISSIVLTCSTNNAEGNVSATPGTVAVDGTTITISGINAKSTVIADTHTGTGAASQLRISNLKITYAQ